MDESFISLHKYFLSADRFKKLFQDYLNNEYDQDGQPEDPVLNNYMLTWYGSLFVVVEGWQKLKLQNEKVDEFLENADFIDKLRRCRNGVFHYQEQYYPKKIVEFFDEGSAKWISGLHDSISTHFLEEFKKRKAERKDS